MELYSVCFCELNLYFIIDKSPLHFKQQGKAYSMITCFVEGRQLIEIVFHMVVFF